MASKADSSGLSVISERTSAGKHHDNSDDYESVYSNHKAKSIYGGGQKKKLHPLLLGPSRHNPGKIISLHAASKNNLSEFTQRIMSAKLIRTKQVQNQLNETQNQLNELINENRILRNLLKRQEGALKKYEGNHAELPQLIRSHNEEIRALKANNKLIKSQLRESNTKLKDRETELEALRDSYNKLKKLSTEKNLLEREKLQKKVEDMQEIIKEQEEKIQVLSRKVLLESKNYRHHLNIEVIKHKETQKDLTSALSMINKLERELLSKDKQLPGGKVLLKRENKNLMPPIVSKTTDMQPKLGTSEDSFLTRERRKSLTHDSPEPELELLNCLESSEDTPSPLQDIFPEISTSKKPSPEMKTTTEITYSKSEKFQINNELSSRSNSSLRSRKNSFKKSVRISRDPALDAKIVAESLSEDIAAIDNLAEKVQSTAINLDNKEDINCLFEELKTKSSKIELDPNQLIKEDTEAGEENSKQFKQEERRSVSKRKLEEDNEPNQVGDLQAEFELPKDLPKSQQQKLENMSKTWNNLKSKIQEERKKAEEKMKELRKITRGPNAQDTSSESDSEKIEEDFSPETNLKLDTNELSFANFTDDSYILQELEKTDKIFNKLKNESKKSDRKTPTPSVTEKKQKANSVDKPKQKQQPEIQNFRTESRREPKYLEEFQSEYQKQNLLKALKAIDIRKDASFSTDESDNSEPETKRENLVQKKNGLKHVKQLSSESDKGLMAELFGSRHKFDKSENLNLEYGTVTSVNE